MPDEENEEKTPPAKKPRGKKDGVLVKALQPIAEEIDGNVERFATGETFTISAERVTALGKMVEAVK